MNKKQKKMLTRIIVATMLTIVVTLVPDITVLPLGGVANGLLYYLIIYIIIGYDILRKSWLGICNRRVFDENFLMTVATIGAFALAIYTGSGDYLEGIAVMLFYQTGEFFQGYAVGKSRRDIAALMDIRPDYANIIDEESGELERVDPDEVEVGQTIVVLPGEKVPIDGIVTEGTSALNTSALTGESLPRDVGVGDDIISGSINMTGVLKIKTTKEFDESTVSKILELVEDSASHKSKSEDFIVRFARYYTPAVCYSALALALSGLVIPQMGGMSESIYRALTFLVISCPCALVVSIPLSFFAGIGGASREGILVKGGNILETLSKVKTVVMDKTGTLTKGVFEVTDVCCAEDSGMSREELLEIAALAESASSHPIAKSLMQAYGKAFDHARVTDIQEISGHGITAMIDGRKVSIGNRKMIKDAATVDAIGTQVHIAMDGRYVGSITLGDVVKATSAEAMAALHKAGVTRTVMLTGDNSSVANRVAKELGIDTVFSELLPADKVSRVEELLSKNGALAFVGDGINDAPVLSRADIGIAMGAIGSDAAIEAADVVLMDDDPLKIAKAIRISRKTIGIVWQNIVMALGIKGVCLILGALGIANMWLAIFADVGVMVLAVLNAIRAMHVKNC